MRSNPNTVFHPSSSLDYIPPQNMVVVVVPNADPTGSHTQAEIDHEVRVVLGDRLHMVPDEARWITVSNDQATFHHTITSRAIGLVSFREAVTNLAERHGFGHIGYTYGPLGGVTTDGEITFCKEH